MHETSLLWVPSRVAVGEFVGQTIRSPFFPGSRMSEKLRGLDYFYSNLGKVELGLGVFPNKIEVPVLSRGITDGASHVDSSVADVCGPINDLAKKAVEASLQKRLLEEYLRQAAIFIDRIGFMTISAQLESDSEGYRISRIVELYAYSQG
jgi:hypothetical protein